MRRRRKIGVQFFSDGAEWGLDRGERLFWTGVPSDPCRPRVWVAPRARTSQPFFFFFLGGGGGGLFGVSCAFPFFSYYLDHIDNHLNLVKDPRQSAPGALPRHYHRRHRCILLVGLILELACRRYCIAPSLGLLARLGHNPRTPKPTTPPPPPLPPGPTPWHGWGLYGGGVR